MNNINSLGLFVINHGNGSFHLKIASLEFLLKVVDLLSQFILFCSHVSKGLLI